jgi:threonine synthase
MRQQLKSQLAPDVASLSCPSCGEQASEAGPAFRCPQCGDLLEVRYDGWPHARDITAWKNRWRERKASHQPFDRSGVWRFRELLPFLEDLASVVTLSEGNTPLYDLPRCARNAGMDWLAAKHQGMNPTGSFKDTGMTTVVSKALVDGVSWVACASTGNTSASMAAYAARAGLGSLVLVPQAKISAAKLSQALEYGALVCQLPTDFDGCLRVLLEVAEMAPIYVVNSVNPYRVEGQKTAAVELLEQMHWEVPDHVIVPGGNLANSSAIGKAFLELRSWGFISRLPKISIIQAEGANPLVRTMREAEGERLVAVQPETRATAIRIGAPASWKKAVRVLRESGGCCEQVTEEEIASAKADLGREGIGCEPASAVTLAGLYKLRRLGFVQSYESAVLILTGHLLKDSEYTLQFHSSELFPPSEQAQVKGANPPVSSEANAKSVLELLKRHAQEGFLP